jgi:tetratricopeptide (TPR) repeat protein
MESGWLALARRLLVALAVLWCAATSQYGAVKRDDPWDHVIEGNEQFVRCNPGGAIVEYSVALHMKPRLIGAVRDRLAAAHFILSERLARQKDIPRSLFELKQALELKPKEAYWHLALALLEDKAGDLTTAREECNKAMKLESKDTGMIETCSDLGKSFSYFTNEEGTDPQARAFANLDEMKTDTSAPLLLHIPRSNYHWETTGYRGIVAMIASVGVNGRVGEMQIVKPMGLGLDKKALRLVGKATFKPAMRKEKPVETRVLVDVVFGPSCH